VAFGEIDFMEVARNHFFPRDVDADMKASWKPDPGLDRSDKGFALWIMDLLQAAELRIPTACFWRFSSWR